MRSNQFKTNVWEISNLYVQRIRDQPGAFYLAFYFVLTQKLDLWVTKYVLPVKDFCDSSNANVNSQICYCNIPSQENCIMFLQRNTDSHVATV